MTHLALESRVLLLTMVPVLLFVLVLSGGAVLILRKQVGAEVKDTRERLLDDRRIEFEHYVQTVMGSIQAKYDRPVDDGLNARAEAITRLSKVKYGKGGYIFGYSSQVVRLFRGDSPVDIGENFRDRCDPSGVYLNRELVEVGKNGSHYVTYTSSLPGDKSVMVSKLSYTLCLPKWDMVISSAVNLDGVEAQLVEIKQVIDECIDTLIASTVAAAGVFLVVLLVIDPAVANAMLRPLHQIHQNLDSIATDEGDLTRRLPVTSHDKLSELAGSFNRFVKKIHGLVRQIVGTTGDLKQLMEQVLAQAEHSKQAMERRRHETGQVTAAINEISAAAHEVTQNIQRAAKAAQQADHEGQVARRVVGGSIKHIHALVDGICDSGSSLDSLQQDVQSIVSVLGVIRSIAEQTNLLALSAAIEAVRAGEVGRGFAVIANEVRALTSRTQQSTREIQGMIGRLRQGINATVDAMRRSGGTGEGTSNQASQAGDPLDAIAQLIATTNAMNAQIANATEEQTAVAEGISRSVHQIAGTVDNVADEIQQGAQTACGLVQLGQGSGRLVGQFRT